MGVDRYELCLVLVFTTLLSAPHWIPIASRYRLAIVPFLRRCCEETAFWRPGTAIIQDGLIYSIGDTIPASERTSATIYYTQIVYLLLYIVSILASWSYETRLCLPSDITLLFKFLLVSLLLIASTKKINLAIFSALSMVTKAVSRPENEWMNRPRGLRCVLERERAGLLFT